MQSIEQFRAEALSWLEAHAERRPPRGELVWGEGSDSVALFQNMSHEEERTHIDAQRRWVQRKADAGFANITWAPEFGGRGLPRDYEAVFNELEEAFVTSPSHEAVSITTNLIAPTIRAKGTDVQRARFLRPMLRTDEMWCQLFSEPEAGSDLAGLSTRAERDGDEWVLNGQKVWTSGAQFADFGYILCRTDPAAPKHKGITAFIISMDQPGVEVRPLRQLTGGTSFNEVFLTDVRVNDEARLGEVGDGWDVAITTLGFERSSSSGYRSVETVDRLIALARHLGRDRDPLVRQQLARAYTHQRLLSITAGRAKARVRAGETPGPEGSIGKLSWTQGLQLYNKIASDVLGPRLVADTGEWGTYAWAEHLFGGVGYRIAGGTDEIQRNILSERLLGLPR